METERLFNELQDRNEIAETHKNHDGESASKDSRPFTTFDPVHREAATASSNLEKLMEALKQAQREPVVPTIPTVPVVPTIHNDQAFGLQILADASAAPPATGTKTEVENKVKAVPEPPVQQSLKVPTPTLSRAPEPSNLSVPKPSLSRAQDQFLPTITSQPPLQETRWPAEPRIWPQEYAPTGAPNSFKSVVLQSPFSETAPPAASQVKQSLQPAFSAHHPEHATQTAPKLHNTETAAPRLEKNDFWSSLARGETPAQRIETTGVAPKEDPQPATTEPGLNAPQRVLGKPTESDFPPAATDQHKAHNRPSLPANSTVLEPLSQRLRSTSDSFGPLLNGPSPTDFHPQSHKPKAPKRSLWGPWPRGRNYDPSDGRRASNASSGSQEGYNRPPTGAFMPQITPDNRQQPYSHPPPHPGPGYPASSPYSSGYPAPPPMYAAAPLPPHYGYDPRGPPYQPPPPYGGPTGFSSLPGAPMTQGPPQSQYYAPHPPSQQGPYQGAPMTSRPPPPPAAYGPQYGGQPILPAASHDPRYGQNGAPPAGAAGPAFAQYQNNDDRRRRNQSFGDQGGKFRHYYGPR